MPGTNVTVYLAELLVTKKRSLNIDAWAQYYLTFWLFFSDEKAKKARVFVPDKLFQLGLIFECKANLSRLHHYLQILD